MASAAMSWKDKRAYLADLSDWRMKKNKDSLPA